MLPVLIKTLPFFALIGLGYIAGRTRFFTAEGVAWLTKFVFYFALPAMLFAFSANIVVYQVFDLQFVLAYLCASGLLYAVVMAISRLRGRSIEVAAMEAQCAQSGNTGFLGVPLVVGLFGYLAVVPMLMVLTIDMVVFASLITLIITGQRGGGRGLAMLKAVALGWVKNPMVVSIVLGLFWSTANLPLPRTAFDFLETLGGAATPCALFAIGASLAGHGITRLGDAAWLSFAKLILHPALAAIAAFLVFDVDTHSAGVMVAAASLPVAGNVYILAQHYGVATQRVSTAILVSTAASILTVTTVIAWVTG